MERENGSVGLVQRWVWIWVLLIGSVPTVVLAEPSEEEVRRFTGLVSEATEAQEEGDHAWAIELYREAARINDHPRLQIQIARSYGALRDCERAIEVLERLLARRELGDDLRERAISDREGMTPCRANGRLVVQCFPSSLDVSLRVEEGGLMRKTDGCPVRWSLPEGEYELIAEASGFDSRRIPVRLVSEEAQEETLRFEQESVAEKSPAPAWVMYGSLAALGAGAGLGTVALLSDREAPQRAESLREVQRACEVDTSQCSLVEEWENYNQGIRQRNRAFFVTGGVLVVGGGAGLVWSLMRRGAGSDEGGFSVAMPPGQVVLEWRW